MNEIYFIIYLGCGHCKNMKPAFGEAALKLTAEKVNII